HALLGAEISSRSRSFASFLQDIPGGLTVAGAKAEKSWEVGTIGYAKCLLLHRLNRALNGVITETGRTSRVGERFMRLARTRRDEWMMSSFLHEGIQHYVRVGGEWVEVTEMGQGEPIVLVPGLAGGARLLGPLAHLLARRHRVITYDLRGEKF